MFKIITLIIVLCILMPDYSFAEALHYTCKDDSYYRNKVINLTINLEKNELIYKSDGFTLPLNIEYNKYGIINSSKSYAGVTAILSFDKINLLLYETEVGLPKRADEKPKNRYYVIVSKA